ncbi:nuclear transport factor 2 family protein [Pseudonocardia kujensis]|uniref:YybH family protein n=1 Tax=Pseudonocardia kujensis TaxID=1128675 RepID=UPI001E38D177|nr:nuclear transport factor 2 family protein [Pseudonocardia kujensis]MCE0763291.1 nuclear transport factor 2 family protein [Pseudonocardia kujensis]
MTDHDKDLAAIRELHDGWFAANVGLDADTLPRFFPSGNAYLQFNLNGFVYNGLAEKVKLWRNLSSVGVDIVRIEDTSTPVIQVFGDVALLTSEGEAELVLPSPTGKLESSGATRFRNTEFYRRDDGAGNPDWRIWHMHVSEGAPEGQLKYGTE